jgi:hypothetical protein
MVRRCVLVRRRRRQKYLFVVHAVLYELTSKLGSGLFHVVNE